MTSGCLGKKMHLKKMIRKEVSYVVVLLIVAVVFWMNTFSNNRSFDYIVLLNNINVPQNSFEINKTNTDVENKSDKKQEKEVVSYIISSDNKINTENEVTDFNGAMDLFSNYFYHSSACQRISDVGKKNNPSIVVSAIQQPHQTRLGNQLGNFASGYAIWRDFGILNYIDPEQLHIIGNVFELPKYEETDNDACYHTWLKGCLKFVDAIKWTTFNQTLLDLSAPRQHLTTLKRGHYIKLQTYVQDVQGFVPYANDLKTNVFKFHKKFRAVSRRLYKMMIERANTNITDRKVLNFTTVSIHIRLTDFGSHLKNWWDITYAQPEYFSNAMQYFTDRYQDVLFYLVSDDIPSAKKYVFTEENEKFNIVLPYNGTRKVVGKFVPGVDLALLSLSDHSIVTYGTYGMWGSLLGKGDDRLTIFPKDFLKTDVGIEVNKVKSPNWIFL